MRVPFRQLHRHRAWATLLGHTPGLARRPLRAAPRPAPAASAQSAQSAAEIERQAEIERELLLARDIQQGLLLEAVPRVPGWEISAVSIPARDLGGDLYDFLPLAAGRQGIMIGDVSGKGLPAALRMAVARTVFRHEARRGLAPGVTLAATNRGVLSEIPQGMVTMLYATLDTARGTLHMANAGHNYPVLVNGRVQEVELSGLPLGVDGDSEYDETYATVEHGDTLLFYTDGVVEATRADEEMYGYERLEALIQSNPGRKPRALMAALLHDLRAWSGHGQADDITMVIVRRRLAHLDAELQSVTEDVLGRERSMVLWESMELPSRAAPIDDWAAVLPELVRVVQTQFGRAFARELNGQLRLALEEYR